MKVYALIGESGSGKSYRALQLADEKGISAIIDDGLLIVDGQYVAGYSGKYELNRIASVKRAVFLNREHAEEVRRALQRLKPEKILVLGTSDRMVERIVSTLALPPIAERIYMEDITSLEERTIARTMRHAGNHAIPLPRIQVEEAGLGKWIRDVRSLFLPAVRKKEEDVLETTIVQPRFAWGGVYIHPRVFRAIIARRVRNHPLVAKLIHTEIDLKMGLSIALHVIVRYDEALYSALETMAAEVQKELRYLTGVPQIILQIHVQDIERGR